MEKYKFLLSNYSKQLSPKACFRQSSKMLPVTDWLDDMPELLNEYDLVEVQFKNTRKGYFHNIDRQNLSKGDLVVVEANPGYDIGEITICGKLVEDQIKKNHIDTSRYEIKNILRLANSKDIEIRNLAKSKEQMTMIKARQIAKDLELQMKIGDVEYQGDGTKAIFYYIADERVDFRQLIKVYAETFHVRIEMKQIGARQEAGRIGGTGPCGRELCCSTWLTNFRSVTTNAAKIQNLSPNPQKLAGQCAKLKCCLNFEVPIYEEALKEFPSKDIVLYTTEGSWYFFSSDPLRQLITYSQEKNKPINLKSISLNRTWAIINANKNGELVEHLIELDNQKLQPKILNYESGVGQDDLTRFDKVKKDKKGGRTDSKSKKANSHRIQ